MKTARRPGTGSALQPQLGAPSSPRWQDRRQARDLRQRQVGKARCLFGEGADDDGIGAGRRVPARAAAGRSRDRPCPSGSVEVVTVERYGAAAANVVYRTFDGRMDERVVLAGQESDLRVIVDEPAARFDGDGELFRLGMEARRIAMAARFDPMLAVTTSDLEPLPHQIKAVYGGPPRAAATARQDAARRQLPMPQLPEAATSRQLRRPDGADMGPPPHSCGPGPSR